MNTIQITPHTTLKPNEGQLLTRFLREGHRLSHQEMLPTTLGGLSPDEFDQLIDSFIEREDPYAISLDVLMELDGMSSMPTESEQVASLVSGETRGKRA